MCWTYLSETFKTTLLKRKTRLISEGKVSPTWFTTSKFAVDHPIKREYFQMDSTVALFQINIILRILLVIVSYYQISNEQKIEEFILSKNCTFGKKKRMR